MDRDHAAALFANDAFYNAFATGDLAAMEDVWAKAHPVSCIHPNDGIILDRAAIMDSWRQILENGGLDIHCAEAEARVRDGFAVVTCFELLGDGCLAATNLFVKEGSSWKMAHHQAGPSATRPAPKDRQGPAVQ